MPDCALFIHSTGLGPFMWSKLRSAAPADLATITPSNVGYPPRPLLARGAPFRIEDEIGALMEAVPREADRIHLIAHSYAGLVALRMAQAWPDRVASVWAFEPIVFGALDAARETLSADALREVRYFFDDTTFARDDAYGGTEGWLEVFVDYWNGKGTWARMPEPMRATQLALGWKVYREVQCVVTSGPFETLAVDVPLTLVHGGASTAATGPMIEGLARVNPHAHVKVLPELPHSAPLTQPAAVAPSIAAHFDRLRGG